MQRSGARVDEQSDKKHEDGLSSIKVSLVAICKMRTFLAWNYVEQEVIIYQQPG